MGSRIRSIKLIESYDLPAAITTGTAGQIAKFNITGYEGFTVTVKSSATAVVNYSIYTAPKDETELYTMITATSVAIGSGSDSVTKNTFSGNHQAWLKVLASSTATIPVGALRVIFSATEE